MKTKQKKNITRRQFLRTAAYSSIFLSGGLGYQQAGDIETLSVNIPIKGFPNPLQDFTIGILADLHAGAWGNREIITKAIDLLMDTKPDVICLLGDYVDGTKSHDSNNMAKALFVFDELARLSAPGGVYAVLGNHDHWIDANMVIQLLEKNSIRVLNNEHRQLSNGLVIAGVDDYWEGPANPQKALQGIRQDQPTILLSHNPDINTYLAETSPVDLVLSGHTHGGQIRIPFCHRAPWVPSSPKYRGPSGLIRETKDRSTFISKGVGTFLLPVRLFCPPDVSLLRMTARQ